MPPHDSGPLRFRALRRLLAAGLLAGSAGAVGCSPLESGPDVDDAVEGLAAALSAGEPDRVPWVSEGDVDPVERLTEVMEGVDTPPEVRAGEAEESDDGTATASLTWTWERETDTWEYATDVAMRRPDGAEEWQVVWSDALVEPSLTPTERLVESRVRATRGDIVGAGGRAIVEPREVVRVGVSKEGLTPREAVVAAREVAGIVGVDRASYAARVRASGERAFVEAIVLRFDDVGRALRRALDAVPGSLLLDDEVPLPPTRDFAAALLGSVGPATAEVVEESDGRVLAGDEVGISGLQARYDAQLAGTAGTELEALDEQTGASRSLWLASPVPGEPLELSLDVRLQGLAQDLLADVDPASAIVALRPSTGELLAAASGPGSEGYNTATFGQYAPGSTFKIVSSLALLRAGLDPGSRLDCPATTTVDGRVFTNYDDYPASGLGAITLRQALANSCNTAFIGARDRLDADGLASAAAALGLGVDHDLGFPAYFGQVPPAETETGAAADMIGQGTVLASPMAMAAVMASVVRGEAVLPRLVAGVEVAPVEPTAPLRPAEARALRAMLRGVVTDGSGSALADVPGPPVLAKTGTAEYGEPTGGSLPTHAWMVAAQGDLAVAVFVETGESGSRTAGPLVEAVLRGR